MTEPTAPTPTPTPAPAPAPEPEKDKENPIQKRIAQLFGEKKEAQERAQQLESQNQQLQAQLLEVQEQINLLRSAPPPSPIPAAVVPDVSGNAGLEKTVVAAIEKLVGPKLEELQRIRAADLLMTQQRRSFEQAVAENPDLRDPNSDLYKAADEILRRDSSFATHPHGPQLAAVLARGLLAERGGHPASPAQKIAAATFPATGPGPQATQTPEDRVKELRGKLETLYAEMKTSRAPHVLWDQRNAIVSEIETLEKQTKK